jgi:predicted transcriptional regulator of viral defense system
MGRYDAIDTRIAAIAARQHRLVHRAQVYEAGLRRGALRSRVERGIYVEHRPGVFALAGAEGSPLQRIMGAVLAVGPTAFASHVSALYVHGLVEFASGAVPLEATVVLERRPKVPGVRVHRSGLLVEHDITNVTGIPVASVERTIVDLSSRRTPDALARLLDEALRRRLTSLGRVVRCAARLPRAPGRSPKTLAEVLEPAPRRYDGSGERARGFRV